MDIHDTYIHEERGEPFNSTLDKQYDRRPLFGSTSVDRPGQQEDPRSGVASSSREPRYISHAARQAAGEFRLPTTVSFLVGFFVFVVVALSLVYGFWPFAVLVFGGITGLFVLVKGILFGLSSD